MIVRSGLNGQSCAVHQMCFCREYDMRTKFGATLKFMVSYTCVVLIPLPRDNRTTR